MSLTELLKDKLSDEEYKKVGSALQKEISKIMIPKEDFNKVNEDKKSLIEDKKTLETEKGKVEADLIKANEKIEAKENDKLTEMEKMQKSIDDLTQTVTDTESKRVDLETQLSNNALKSAKHKIYKEKEIDLNPEYFDYMDSLLKDVKLDEVKNKLTEMAKTKKEIFGVNSLKGATPTTGEKTPEGLFTKAQVEGMNQKQMVENYDKIVESQAAW